MKGCDTNEQKERKEIYMESTRNRTMKRTTNAHTDKEGKRMKKENCEDPVIKARGHSRSTTVIFLLYY